MNLGYCFKKKKWGCALLALLLCLVLLAGCGTDAGGQSGETGNSPATADSLVIAITKDENSLTPFTYVSSTGLTVNRLIYDTLFTTDPDNNVVPWMVEDDYSVSDGYRTFTLTLLEGQKFHDGTPVTSEDVAFSLQYPATQNVASQRKICNQIESIDCPDARTVIIHLAAPDINFLRGGLCEMRIISKAQYESVEDASTVHEAIGSGPYQLAEYKTGEYYVLQAVEDYFKGTPKVGRINMPIMTDSTAVQTSLLSGELAAATSSISIEMLETFNAAPGIEIFANPGYAPMIMNINNGAEILNDPVFRDALCYAVDVKGIMQTLYGEYCIVGTRGVIRPDMPYSVDGLDYVYDPQQANALLDAAGYPLGADGIRMDKSGETPCAFDILVYSGNTVRIRAAEMMAEQLKEIGVQLSVKVMEMDTVDAYVWPDFEVSAGRDYDLAMWGWGTSINPDFLVNMFSSDYSIGTYNVCGYVNAQVDEIVTGAYAAAEDEETLYAALREIQTIVAEDPGLICFGYADTLQACNTAQYSGFCAGKGMNVVNLYSFLDV